MFAGAAVPPQGLVWLAEATGPQGSVFWVTGHELGRASIKSNKVVCCEWEPGCEDKQKEWFHLVTVIANIHILSINISSYHNTGLLGGSPEGLGN